MKKILFVAFAFVLLLTLATGTPAHAGGALCSVDPTGGPAGTIFTFSCSGFDPNTGVDIYVVEPDGSATNCDYWAVEPYENCVGKTDKHGNVTFRWISASHENRFIIGAALGTYTWVVRETTGAEAHVDVNIASGGEVVSGAVLAMTPGAGQVFAFTGTGFTPEEIVSVWLTVPVDCSSVSTGVTYQSLDLGFGFGGGPVVSGLFSIGNVKADNTGTINFALAFLPLACRGDYALTARALGSHKGATVYFQVTGNSVSPTGAVISVNPNSVPAVAPFFDLNGAGFPAGSGISCWVTRPDGRVANVGHARADAEGSFSLATGVGSAFYVNATFTQLMAEPGEWSATCATADRSALAVTTFTVYGLPSDP